LFTRSIDSIYLTELLTRSCGTNCVTPQPTISITTKTNLKDQAQTYLATGLSERQTFFWSNRQALNRASTLVFALAEYPSQSFSSGKTTRHPISCTPASELCLTEDFTQNQSAKPHPITMIKYTNSNNHPNNMGPAINLNVSSHPGSFNKLT